jgi:hypothetical protein
MYIRGGGWAKKKKEHERRRRIVGAERVRRDSRGRKDPPIFVGAAVPLAEVRRSGRVGVCIELEPHLDLPEDAFDRAREAARSAEGRGPLVVEWHNGESGEGASRFTSVSLGVKPTPDLLEELRSVFGPERVRLVDEEG